MKLYCFLYLPNMKCVFMNTKDETKNRVVELKSRGVPFLLFRYDEPSQIYAPVEVHAL